MIRAYGLHGDRLKSVAADTEKTVWWDLSAISAHGTV